MSRFWQVGSLLIFLSGTLGCASSGDIEARVGKLREEVFAEIRSQASASREESAKQASQVADKLKKDIDQVDNNLQKKMAALQSSTEKETSALKETHEKDTLEINKTLIEHQKQIFNNRAMLDEASRRVYLLESVVTARNAVVPQVKEGYVVFTNGDEISISIGSANGVRADDQFGVYNNDQRIGTLKIDTAEANSSKGTMVDKTGAVSIGDKVEKKK